MRQITILFLLFISSSLSFCCLGQFELKERSRITQTKPDFRVDELGYFTFFTKDRIEKNDTNGVLLFKQSVKLLGKIDCIDVSNPMRPMVFFKEQQVVAFFDNTLTPHQQITRLSDLDISYATLACYSNQSNRFWIYDQDNSKLIQFNQELKKMIETQNLAGLLALDNPIQLLERNNILYLVDENKGVYLFDMYGTFIEFVEITGVEWIQADENTLYYIQDAHLWSLNRRTKNKFKIALKETFSPYFQYSKKKFYFALEKNLIVYEILPLKNDD
jgi:hypothetical protein